MRAWLTRILEAFSRPATVFTASILDSAFNPNGEYLLLVKIEHGDLFKIAALKHHGEKLKFLVEERKSLNEKRSLDGERAPPVVQEFTGVFSASERIGKERQE